MPRVRTGVSLSGYNPAISADGRHVAYQAQRRGGQSAVYVTDLRSGRSTLASRGARSAPGADDGVYDPAISGDGRFVAFTTAASNLGGGDLRGRTQVFVRDLKARTTTLVSRASGARGAVADDYSADAGGVARRALRRVLVGGAQPRRRQPRLARLRPRPAHAPDARGQRRRRLRDRAVDQRGRAHGRVHLDRARGVARARPRRARARPRAPRLARERRATARSPTAARRTRRSRPTAAGSRSPRPRRTSPPASRTIAAACSSATCGRRRRRSSARRCRRPRWPRAPRRRRWRGPKASPEGVVPQRSATLPRTSVVSIFDNAFFRSRDRPTVRLRAGGVLTFRWASQQSHQVTVRSGPDSVVSPAKAAGVYSARLTKPGTYEFVCAIHAPGMRMTARRGLTQRPNLVRTANPQRCRRPVRSAGPES